jgi:hypothetical protein
MGSLDTETAFSRTSLTDSRRELVQRVVTSAPFSKSERLSSLLLYICDIALNGRAYELSEQNIGAAVFGRSRDYDSANDGIVRTQVSRLRQKLDLYFDGAGADEPVRIVIPRGSYVPFFEPRSSEEIATPSGTAIPATETVTVGPLAEPPSVKSQRPQATLPARSSAFAWSLVAALAIAVLVQSLKDRHTDAKAQPAHATGHPFWNQIFAAGQQTMIVPADSNLVLWQGLMNRNIGLAEYLSADYRTTIPTTATPVQKIALGLARGRYTSMTDLEMLQFFSQIAQSERSNLKARYARDLRPNDLKQGNIILSGAPEANPWVELFEHDMNFVFSYDRVHHITSVLNHAPRGGEPRQWDFKNTDGQHHVYGVVAYLPNLSGNGNVLIIEGTTIAGTESALDFVADDSQLLPFLTQIQRPDGKFPHFEVVLGTNNLSGNAVKNSILAWHTTN